MDIGQKYVLHGLRAGRLQLRTAPPEWPREVQRGRERLEILVPHQKTRIERVGTSPEIPMQLRVQLLRRCDLTVRSTTPIDVENLRAWIRDSDERIESIDFELAAKPSRHECKLSVGLPDRTVELLLLSNGADSHDTGSYSLTSLADGVRHATIRLEPAAKARGVLIGSRGQPLANTELAWTLPGWRHDDRTAWVYRTKTSANGEFAIGGLPPGKELTSRRPGTELGPVDAGQIKRVRLRSTR